MKSVQIRSFFWSKSSFIPVFSSPNTGKWGPEKTPYFGRFPHGVNILHRNYEITDFFLTSQVLVTFPDFLVILPNFLIIPDFSDQVETPGFVKIVIFVLIKIIDMSNLSPKTVKTCTVKTDIAIFNWNTQSLSLT